MQDPRSSPATMAPIEIPRHENPPPLWSTKGRRSEEWQPPPPRPLRPNRSKSCPALVLPSPKGTAAPTRRVQKLRRLRYRQAKGTPPPHMGSVLGFPETTVN